MVNVGFGYTRQPTKKLSSEVSAIKTHRPTPLAASKKHDSLTKKAVVKTQNVYVVCKNDLRLQDIGSRVATVSVTRHTQATVFGFAGNGKRERQNRKYRGSETLFMQAFNSAWAQSVPTRLTIRFEINKH